MSPETMIMTLLAASTTLVWWQAVRRHVKAQRLFHDADKRRKTALKDRAKAKRANARALAMLRMSVNVLPAKMMKDLIDLREALKQNMTWISAKDGLPEPGEDVAVRVESLDVSLAYPARHRPYGWQVFGHHGDFKVTHWLRLPPTPESAP